MLSAGGEDCAREYVLTIKEHPANSGAALPPLLEDCASRGLPVPTPLRTGTGATALSVYGKPAMLCPRLSGRRVLNPTSAQVASLGRFIARLHADTGAAAPLLPPYPRTIEWLEGQAKSGLPSVPYASQRLMQDAMRGVASLLQRRDVQRLRTGVIHGDLCRGNVLFNGWGLSGVLDFHNAARGFLIYDLAVAANDWCVDAAGGVDATRLHALLTAYHRLRLLEPAELWHLPMFMLYAGLAFWLSRLEGAPEQRSGRVERANDSDVFERIVARHLSTPVAVDPRQLDQNVAARER